MLSQFCIRRPIFATVLSLIIILAGLVALRVLPLSQYPNITPPTVRISATYDGADSETISRTVAAPIEDQLSGIEGLLYYTTSIRSNGDMSIACVFDVGVNANDAMLEINNRVRTAERRLPDTVREQGVSVRKRTDEDLLMLALWSPDGSMSATEMADYANLNIVDELKRLPGIGDVNVFGNVQSAMRIWLDPEKMGKLGVTTKDVENAVDDQNAQRSAGRVGSAPTLPDQQLYYTITTPGQLLTPEEFGNIVVRDDGPTGLVRIRDVAILTLFLGTGIRISELVGLNNEDIDFTTNSFKVTRKGGNQAILYFSDEVADALARYLAYKEEDKNTPEQEHALFLSIKMRRISVRAVEDLVKKYSRIVSPLKKISPHKLRSTYGTQLYRETKDIYVVADVLGHKDVNTTRKHYAAISEDIRRNVADKVRLREPKKKDDPDD